LDQSLTKSGKGTICRIPVTFLIRRRFRNITAAIKLLNQACRCLFLSSKVQFQNKFLDFVFQRAKTALDLTNCFSIKISFHLGSFQQTYSKPQTEQNSLQRTLIGLGKYPKERIFLKSLQAGSETLSKNASSNTALDGR